MSGTEDFLQHTPRQNLRKRLKRNNDHLTENPPESNFLMLHAFAQNTLLPRSEVLRCLENNWLIDNSHTLAESISRKGKADREMTMSPRLRVPNAVSATICLRLCTSRFLHNKAIKSLRISLRCVRIAFPAGNRSEMKPGNEMNKTIAYQQFSRHVC